MSFEEDWELELELEEEYGEEDLEESLGEGGDHFRRLGLFVYG